MSLIRKSNQQTFLDLYPDISDFKGDLEEVYSTLAPDVTDDTKLTTWLLIAGRYGDSPVLGYRDVGRWKLRFFTTYRAKTPAWEVQTAIQKQIQAMSVDDIAKGDLAIFNTALNPNTEPSDTELTELEYINSQNTTRHKMNTLDALLRKYQSLDTRIDERYLDSFAKLFSKFTLQDTPLYLYQDNEVDPYE